MTSVHTRHDLAELLGRAGDARLDTRLMVDFVALLAAFGATADDALRDVVVARLRESQPNRSLREDLELRVSTTPDERYLDAWLLAVEEVFLADVGAQRLADVVRPDLKTDLEATVVALALVASEPRNWDCALVAELSRDGLPTIAPWTWITSRSARGLLRPGSPDRTAIRAWLEQSLHAEDARTLRELVREDEAWRSAYLEALRIAQEDVYPLRVDPRQSITAAETIDELESAMRLMSIHLPHIADGVVYEARLASDGIWWHWRGVDRPTVRTPAEVFDHIWGDEVTGECHVTIHPPAASELAIVEDVATSSQSLAAGLEHPRTASIALAVAEDFAQGRLRTGLERAAVIFETGIDEAQDESRWVQAALSTRLAMSEVEARIDAPEVMSAFDRADELIAHTGNALMLLRDDDYDDLVDGAFVDPDRWWGARERLAGAPSDFEITHSLKALARRAKAETPQYDNVVTGAFGAASRARDAARPREYRYAAASDGPHALLDALAAVDPGNDAEFLRRMQAAITAIAATPCPWLDGTLRNALASVAERHVDHAYLPLLRASISPRIGVVPVVLIDTASDEGLVVALRVRVGSEGRDPRIRAIAGEAIERAYEAVALSSPTKLPRDAWDDLSFDIDGLPADAEVDGDSLALPFALAIASLWLGCPPPVDLVATGNVRGVTGAAIGSVDGVLAKVRAVTAAAGGTPVRVLVPEASAAVTDQPSTTLHGVASLADALRLAGLSMADADYLPRWPDRSSLERQLSEDIAYVERQDLAELADLGDPWRALALRLRLAADALSADADADADELVGRARVYASLAYQHAGDVEQAKALLRSSERVELSPDLEPLRTLVQLCAAIDDADWAVCDELSARIDGELARCSKRARQGLLGMVRGTQGRALLHRRRNEDAVTALREAVEWHAAHRRHEVARSRIYLASALRQAGTPSDALDELGIAARELDDMRKVSRPYAHATLVFLRYERARVLVALQRFSEAREEARAAMQSARGMGFWPRLGLLRVVAWAAAGIGDEIGRDDAIDDMRSLAVPSGHEPLRQRLIAIAIAGPDADDDVY